MKRRKPDILYSERLRERRKKCEKCGRITSLQVSHFWGRRHEITRYDDENCDVLCYACHQHFEENPAEYVEWKKKNLGLKKYKELERRHNQYLKRDDGARCKEILIRYK